MEEFLGIIKLFGGNFAPRGWMLCQGQLLSIAEYSALFSILGTTYGGDGITTFALPDLRGRVPLGMGQAFGLANYTQGEKAGAESTILTTSNLPPNNGNISATAKLKVSSKNANKHYATNGDTIAVPGKNEERVGFVASMGYNSETPDTELNDGSIAINVTSSGTGGQSQAINNMQPYLVLNYIICMEGMFPSRS